MRKLFGFLLLCLVVVGGSIGLSQFNADSDDGEVALNPQVVFAPPQLRGETVDVQSKIANDTGSVVQIIATDTSCGCANLDIPALRRATRRAETGLAGGLPPGESVVNLTIDTSGKSKGQHDFQYAFLINQGDNQRDEQGEQRRVVEGFVTVEVQDGIKVVPSAVTVSPQCQTFVVKIYSDSLEVDEVVATHSSHSGIVQANEVVGDAPAGQAIEGGFRHLASYRVTIDFDEMVKRSDEHFWVDFVGSAPVHNVGRVVLQPEIAERSALRAVPPGGLTVAQNKAGEHLNASFLVAAPEASDATLQVNCRDDVAVQVHRLDGASWNVDLQIPPVDRLSEFDLSIRLGERHMSYSVKVIK